MQPATNVSLARLTSLAAGGSAEKLYTVTSTDELTTLLSQLGEEPVWLLGYGANALVSDAGLPGSTLLIRSQDLQLSDGLLVADAGVWWDDLVQFAIAHNLWGLELMSAIPGGVGAAVVGNIAAYGQAVSDTLAWVEVYDLRTQEIIRIEADQLNPGYRYSRFQSDEFGPYVIIRAAFQLSPTSITPLVYQSALDIALELQADTETLAGRRQTILETRRRAGSLWDYHTPESQMHTAGSFFRNPMVDEATAERVMSFDETGKSVELLKKMNLVHGGTQKRVSAAHVLLAAGFHRGQAWGPVRLHPDHILKIENTGGATAQQIYDVAMEIVSTVKTILDIDLIPEVRFLGKF